MFNPKDGDYMTVLKILQKGMDFEVGIKHTVERLLPLQVTPTKPHSTVSSPLGEQIPILSNLLKTQSGKVVTQM